MKTKKIVVTVLGLALSGSVLASTIAYQMTNAGTGKCTITPTSDQSICNQFHPAAPGANSSIDYNTITQVMTFDNPPPAHHFTWQFENDAAHIQDCRSMAGNVKAFSYCANPLNNYVLFTIAGNFHADKSVTYNAIIHANEPAEGFNIHAQINDVTLSPSVPMN